MSISKIVEENYVWIPDHPEYVWWPGKIVSKTDSSITVEDSDSKKFILPSEKATYIKKTSIKNVEDLLQLEDFHEGLLLHSIRNRYFDNCMYTSIGNNVLVAVNPYKQTNSYSDAVKDIYANTTKIELYKTEPHVFKIAEIAFRNMKESLEQGQNVIISGESGAGKTESARFILNYLARRSKHGSLEDRILKTTPLLESFGNAQTVRNDNSSRFGKFFKLEFSNERIAGGVCRNYLLEKSRIVTQSSNERNYHIFYQVFFCTDQKIRARLQLDLAEKYEYLNLDYPKMHEKRIADGTQFAQTLKDLLEIGFSQESVFNLVDILAGVLHLGNVNILGTSDSSEMLSSCPHRIACSNLLGISSESLANLVCFKSFVDPISKTQMKRNLSRSLAITNKDTLAKKIYEQLFNWLVVQTNGYISDRTKVNDANIRSIGILDIFGFEVFPDNSLEQLCINYANEKLQLQFNENMFKFDQILYEQEKINWEGFACVDNSRVIELIDKRPLSIFSLLEEEGFYENGNSERFLEKIRKRFEKDANFLARNMRLKKESFGIRHFAGDVFYSVDKFVEKNKNLPSKEMSEVLSTSENGIVAALFAKERDEHAVSKTPAKMLDSLSGQFVFQMDDLLRELSGSLMLYVRCLKPNKYKAANIFESNDISEQLKATGILEVIKIRKAGFAVRRSFDEVYFSCQFLLNSLGFCQKRDMKKGILRALEFFLCFLEIKKKRKQIIFDKNWANQTKKIPSTLLFALKMNKKVSGNFTKLADEGLKGQKIDRFIQFGTSKVFMKEEVSLIIEFMCERVSQHAARKILGHFKSFKRRKLSQVLFKFVKNALFSNRFVVFVKLENQQIKEKRQRIGYLGEWFLACVNNLKVIYGLQDEIDALRKAVEEKNRIEESKNAEARKKLELLKSFLVEEKVGEISGEEVAILGSKKVEKDQKLSAKIAKQTKTTTPNFKVSKSNYPKHIKESMMNSGREDTGVEIVDMHKAVSDIIEINKLNFPPNCQNDLERKNIELSRVLFEKETKMERLEADNANLTTQFEQLQNREESSKQSFQAKIQMLENEMAKKDTKVGLLGEKLKRARQEITDLQNEVDLTKQELRKKQNEPKKATILAESMSQIRLLRDELESRNHECAKHTERLKETKASFDATFALNAKLEKQLENRKKLADEQREKEARREEEFILKNKQSEQMGQFLIKKNELCNQIMEDLLTLLKWKTIDLKLNENLRKSEYSGSVQSVLKDIASLREEEVLLRDKLECKMQILHDLENSEEGTFN